MRRQYIALLIALAVTSAGTAAAEDAPKGNIHPNVKLSFTERTRLTTWDNAISLHDSAEAGNAFTRHRSSLIAQWYAVDGLELTVKVTNEFRKYFVPENRDFHLDEVFIDQLYLKYHNRIGLKGTFTIGRQDIILGEGFVMLDGGPLDGSRAIYFNALRYDWQINDKNRLTAFGLYQPRMDQYLPVIHDQDKVLIEQTTWAAGGYFTSKLKKTDIDAYYIYKNTDPYGTPSSISKVSTIGGRFKVPARDRATLTLEAAYQFGEITSVFSEPELEASYIELGTVDHRAFGGHANMEWKTGWPNFAPTTVTIGGVYLTGDDTSTAKNEGWDPVFGRWPKWSESYIYTLINEGGVAYWSNFVSVYGRLFFKFTPATQFYVTYHHLMAPQFSQTAVNLRGDTRTRGNLIVSRVTYDFNKYFSGHIHWEFFNPGGFYDKHSDNSNWLRFEVMFKFE